MVTLGLVDIKTQQLITDASKGLSSTGIVQVDSTMLGSKTANITGLEGSITKISGNNVTQDVVVGPSAPSVALDFNNLDFVIKQKILGNISDGKGGYRYGGSKPHVAVMVESQTLDRANSIYFGFANGIISAPSQNVATDTATAETREDDNMTYSALAAGVWDNEPYKIYYTGDEGFDEAAMMKEVFGGYVANTGSTGTTTTTTTGK